VPREKPLQIAGGRRWIRTTDLLILTGPKELPTSLTAREIAKRLSVSPNTVGTHVKSLHHQPESERRSELVDRAVEAGLPPAGELPH